MHNVFEALTPLTSISSAPKYSDIIVRLTNLALSASDVPSAVTPVLDALVTYTAAVGSAYFQLGGTSYTARAATGIMPEGPLMDHIALHGLPDETPLFKALKRQVTPLFFDDTAVSEMTSGFPDLGVKSLAAAPVQAADGTLLGAFLMHTFECHRWSDSEAALMVTVANTLAALTARLVMQEEVIRTRDDAIRALGLALEYRDNDTKGHTDRVTRLTLTLGAELGVVKPEEVNALRLGAYLHDAGKIGIPDAILLKPGKLTDEEWQVMRGHVTVGHSFAGQLSFIPTAALELIRYHHERWDGKGYPLGLRGEQIPLFARIFSVIDVYDALTSERPYKRAWSHQEAMHEIVSQAGRQFDPALVRAFVRLAEHPSF